MTSTAISKPQTGLAVSAPNPWLDYARSLAVRAYIGLLLLFKKGDFVLGTGDQEKVLAPGTIAIAVVPSSQVGWKKFIGGVPNDHIFVPATRLQLPTRRALGDNDFSLWEVREDGRAKDPWQSTRTMAMVIDDEVCTFSTTSAGGKGFIADLVEQYGLAIERGVTGKLPKIELTVGSYLHKNRSYGRIKIPTFKLLDWVSDAKYLALIGGASDNTAADDTGDHGLPEAREDADRADYNDIF
jgi:hypothetical protein